MPVYPVGGNIPNQISGVYSDRYMIRNAGLVNVYVGNNSSLAPGVQDLTLPPGGTLNWDASSELWVICDAGNSSTIELLTTGDSSFTPGPSTVSVSARVQQLYAKAVQPLTNGVTVVWDSAALAVDLSSYTSLVIALNDPTVISGLDTSRLIQVQVIQYDNAGNQVWIEAPMFYGSGFLNYTTQIRGASVQITAVYVGGATTGNIGVHVSGSQIDQGHKYYQVPGGSALFSGCTDGGSQVKPTSKVADLIANIAASGVGLVYLSTIAGMAYYQYHNGTTANQSQQINGPGSMGYSLLTPLLTATAADYTPPSMIPCPEVPLIWKINNGGAAGTARLLISWE